MAFVSKEVVLRDGDALAGRTRADGSVTEATYRILLDLIESRQLSPGEVVEERRLALRFNVSRTPLRAGISRLLGEGSWSSFPTARWRSAISAWRSCSSSFICVNGVSRPYGITR